jgi:signal transduction histidine kinase
MLKTLKSKVIFSFIVFLLFPILTGGVIILMHVKEIQIDQTRALQQEMTKRVAAELQNYINYNISQLRQNIELKDFYLKNMNRLRHQLTSQIMYNNLFDEIIFLNSDGHKIVHTHRYKVITKNDLHNYTNRIEYIFPKINKDIYYGNIRFIKDTGEPIIDVSFGIMHEKTNKLAGVVVVALRLKPIWNLLANINVQPGQQVYIMDAKNRLVAHPNPSYVLKNIIYNVPASGEAKGLLGDDVFLEKTKIVFGNQSFTVASEYKTSQALKLYYDTTVVILIVFAIVVATIISMITFYIKYIVNPINHLANVSKEIGKGNLKINATVYKEDEIGAMATAFNKMTKKLKDNNVQLQEFNIGLQNKIDNEIIKTRRIEQMLFEQKKFADMGQMINAIAHQWRQPLNNIGLIQQYLTEGFLNADISTNEYKEMSEKLMKTVDRMSETIDDFRTFFTRNKNREEFNIVESIKDFLKLSTAQLDNDNIKYQIDCSYCEHNHKFDALNMDGKCTEEKLYITGYLGEFKQVIQNLVANSRDAFLEKKIDKPLIKIYVSTENDKHIIRFVDNAGGIPESVLPNIFDPYFTTKEEGKGTGIGLYISKIIIDDHFGGRLSAKNVEDGVEFTISIPKENIT